LRQNIGSTQTLLGGIDENGRHFFFDLQPRPTNEAGDALDGVVMVAGPPADETSHRRPELLSGIGQPEPASDFRLQVSALNLQSPISNLQFSLPVSARGAEVSGLLVHESDGRMTNDLDNPVAWGRSDGKAEDRCPVDVFCHPEIVNGPLLTWRQRVVGDLM